MGNREIRCQEFDRNGDICDFVNRKKIKQKDIQQITRGRYHCAIYYWCVLEVFHDE